jgi:hypothetical protein
MTRETKIVCVIFLYLQCIITVYLCVLDVIYKVWLPHAVEHFVSFLMYYVAMIPAKVTGL